VRKNQIQVISIVTVLLIGFTMFSMANATTPAENKAAGAAFLAENAKKPNIVTTASGLQYEILTPATGTVSPTATANVTVHYKGTTLDGKEFDSSYSRGAPASFPLNRVIAGWTEGVQLMKEGAIYRFYIPSELAYGEQGAGRDIGPNAALIFDVELIKIQ
jgi:FKBP-type peptidyl-prolyl cis-trans isomerase